MPTWNGLVDEFTSLLGTADAPGLDIGNACETLVNKYIQLLAKKTGRNVIVYYSAFLQKPVDAEQNSSSYSVNDNDMNGFMATIHGLDTKIGLDLVLHTPGGGVAATESLVNYLRNKFQGNIRVIVPHLAMSAGTMIACSSKEIIMGKHSSLGPIDPQFGSVSAVGLLQEIDYAISQIKEMPESAALWQPMFQKIPLAFINECRKSVLQSREMAEEWLSTGMFNGIADARGKASEIANNLCDKDRWKSHGRHIPISEAQALGLHVSALEDDHELQEAVLTAHHSCILTLSATTAAKLIKNQNGISYIQTVNQQ